MGVLLVSCGFFVVALGGKILIGIRLSSARVVTGRRVLVLLIGGGRGRLVVELLDLIWLIMGGTRCGKIGSCRGGSFVADVLRGGVGFGDVTMGVFVGFFVITDMGFLVLRDDAGGGGRRVLLLLVVCTEEDEVAAGVVVLTLFTDWNVVNSSRSADDVVPSFFCTGAFVVADGNGTPIVVGLLEDGRLDVEVAAAVDEDGDEDGVEPVGVLSFFLLLLPLPATVDGSLVESVAKIVVL